MRISLAALLLFSFVVALGTTRAADDPTPAARYKELVNQLTAAQKNYVSALYRAKTLKQAHDAFTLKPSTSEYAAKFLKIAQQGPATDGGHDAILWVLSNSPGSFAADECHRLLARDYLDNKQIVNAIRPIVSWPTPEGEKLLRAAMAKSKLESVRADACNTLGALVMARARREAGTDAGKTSYDEAEALFKKLGSEYGSVRAGGMTYGDLSKAALAKLGPKPPDGDRSLRPREGVNVGQKASEIAATNSKGEFTRLSDYEGSVVVLAFWGNWCPWCHDIYPFGRDLKYRTGGKPAVLLGVNSDGSPEQLRRVMASEQITWLNWWDARGPIASRFKIERWPTTFILDHRGVIRYKMEGTVDEESLARAVTTLQDEQAREPNPQAKVRRDENNSPTRKKRTGKKAR